MTKTIISSTDHGEPGNHPLGRLVLHSRKLQYYNEYQYMSKP